MNPKRNPKSRPAGNSKSQILNPKFVAFLPLLFLAACGSDLYHDMFDDMRNQPRFETYEASKFFADRRSARQPVEGTVARGQLNEDELLLTGKIDGKLANVFPFEVTDTVMARGRERFNIYCSPCHDMTGSGNGMVIQRGFKQPPSFHIQRLKDAPHGHFVDVMTNGFGAMYPYRDRVPPNDRWAIAAYVRALQYSQLPAAVKPAADTAAQAGMTH